MPERYGINIDLLIDLGLTQNQAKVYLACAKIGPATISEVAEHSGVRREETYRLLPDLEKIGLVERLIGKPMRIRTPNVKAAMSTLLQNERTKAQERISEFVEKTNKIEDYLSKTGLDVSTDSVDKDDFALLEEKDSVRTRLHEIIKAAENQIDLIYSRPNLIWFLSTQSQLLKEALSNGVKVRLLSNPPSGKDRIPKILSRRFSDASSIELKYMTQIFANYITVDKNAAMIVTSASHQPNAHNLFTRNSNLVSLVQRVFENVWNQSSNWKTVEGIMITEKPEVLVAPRSILFVYRNNNHKQKVISNFINSSLENGCYIFYQCSKHQIDDVNSFLTSSGIDVKDLVSKGVLQVLDLSEFLIGDNEFSIEKVIDTWDEVYLHANEMSLHVVSVTDMQFFFENNLSDYLSAFEEEINNLLDPHMSAMCVYNEEAILGMKEPFAFYNKIVVKHDKIFTEEDE